MCDTIVSFKTTDNGKSFFGKNSDREPGELQFIDVSIEPVREFEENPFYESLVKYTEGPLINLKEIFYKFKHPYKAVLSRPVWMWGAEMGVNEKGLTIGNEAVFSKEKPSKTGLLGMDILRLALHNTSNSAEARDFIISLITQYGQGGDGGYKSSLYYHNSFLIMDGKEAIVLETSGKNYAWKNVESSASISNCYTIIDNKTQMDSKDLKTNFGNFKKHYEGKFYTFFSRGNVRQSYTSKYLKNNKSSLDSIKSLLRSHMSDTDVPGRNMSSVCIHARGIVKSETTASMIVEYGTGSPVIWFTSSPYSCVSTYKPMVLEDAFSDGNPFPDKEYSISYAKDQQVNSYLFAESYSKFTNEASADRDNLEKKFESFVVDGKLDLQDVMQKEKDYLATVKRLF
ncbi:MAG: hypothetical protein KAH95_04115 [Spirochaetales bacterium]|nr:hypothetical protein [Spirochaetales bacterium]